MKRPPALCVFVVLFLVPSCSKAPDLSPPEIHPGQDTCHACGMSVTDPRFAAAVVIVRNGVEEKFIFDDLGEMLEFKVPQADKVVKYVHDYDTGKWINADDAVIAKQDKIETPMATGMIAHGKKPG